MSRKRYKGCAVGKLKRAVIFAAYDSRCWICGETACPPTLDHVLPAFMGGDKRIDNLRPACEVCNSVRGNRLMRLPKAERRAAIKREAEDLRYLAHPLPRIDRGALRGVHPAIVDRLPRELRQKVPA